MTYLKRIVFHIFMLILGGAAALFILNLTGQHLVVPPSLFYLLMALFMALSLAVSQLLVIKLFPLAEGTTPSPASRKQSWAWLRPKGTGVRSGFPLNKDHMVIGREVKCAIMLNDSSVSRQHSSITHLAEGYLIRDLGSSNGTYVNGQRVQEYLLQEGDRVSIGDIEFWFEAPEDDRATATASQSLNFGSSSSSEESSGGGFSLDPSAGHLDDDDEEEGTEAWHPRPDQV